MTYRRRLRTSRLTTVEVHRIVVVGSGVAGSVVAGTLARHCNAEVVVVESGTSAGAILEPDSRGVTFVDSLADSAIADHRLRVRRTAAQEPRAYPRGITVGGSGEINALVASWGMDDDGGDGASWCTECGTLAHDLRTVTEGEWGPVDAALVSSCVANGVERNDALWNDTTSPEGVGVATIFARGNRRSNGVDAYLRPAIASGRVRVERGRTVARVRVVDRRVRGVDFDDDSTVDASAVVLCAGAFGSPQILMRSGLAPRRLVGIQDHPALAFVTRSPLAVDSRLSIGALARLSSTHGRGDVHLVPMNATAPGERSHGALLVALMDVTSRGSVALADDESLVAELDMLSHRSECDALLDALRRVVPIVRGMEDRLGVEFALTDSEESVGWLEDARDEEVVDWMMSTSGVYAHAASSLPMGAGVVGADGSVDGVRGAWVADASVMARLGAGNPTLAIAALARRIARRVASSAS